LCVAVCTFGIDSERSRSGAITSPNNPGLYPRNVECRYVFSGQPGDRSVSVNFTRFDVEGLPPESVAFILAYCTIIY